MKYNDIPEIADAAITALIIALAFHDMNISHKMNMGIIIITKIIIHAKSIISLATSFL
jgi:hypothetical protein